jgi:hypothetical protein
VTRATTGRALAVLVTPPLLAFTLLAALGLGCFGSAIRPGAYNRVDSDAWGSLVVAGALLDDVRAECHTADTMTRFNVVAATYNATLSAYRLYHHELEAGGHPSAGTLAADAAAIAADLGTMLATLKPPPKETP